MYTKFLLTALFVTFAIAQDVDESDVLVLGEDNFNAAVTDNKAILIEFYAPLVPEYAKAATAVKGDNIVLAKVDATEHQDLATRFEVRGYPTLKFFKNGNPKDYNGGRDADSIAKWVRAHSGDAATALADDAAVATFVSSVQDHDAAFVGEFKSADDSAAHSAFMRVAEELREDYKFGVRVGAADDKIVALRKFEKEASKVELAENLSDDVRVKTFVSNNAVPLAGVLTEANAKRYDALTVPRVVLFHDREPSKDPSGVRYYVNRLRKVGEDFRGKLVFVVGYQQGANGQAYSELGFPADAKFGLAAFSPAGDKYKSDMLEKFTMDGLREFAQSLVDGSAEKHVKSEPLPPADSEEAVQTVVGKNFEDVVTNSKKDVFIEFYAPWCGHCKSLAPKWKRLAEDLRKDGVESITIAAIDATANDYPSTYKVQGFPTIFLKNGATGELKQYDGGREVGAMRNWLAKHAGHKLAKSVDGKDEL